MEARAEFKKTRRWVVKIGSALLTRNGAGLDRQGIAEWAAQMAWLRQQGIEVLLVSSGAVAEGLARLGLKERPSTIHGLQAAAAVGQMGLVEAYERSFQSHGYHTAQILLTHDDLSDRKRYLNARSTLLSLLELGVIPVVNENDTVVTDEIRFGDNDTLGALVANLVEAEVLVLLTDQEGMYDSDPRKDPNATLIQEAMATDSRLVGMATSESGSGLGRGGMVTKVRSAQLAARSGAYTVIAGGRRKDVLLDIFQGNQVGTLLIPEQSPIAARKQWLAGHLQMRGELVLDDGAVHVLKNSGRSLLAVGVKEVRGQFRRGEMVACTSMQGEKVACGLVNYDSEEADKIKGRSTVDIESCLGYIDDEELIHRDNMVIF